MHQECYLPYNVGEARFLVFIGLQVAVLLVDIIDGHARVEDANKAKNIEGQQTDLLIIVCHLENPQ
jgi:hypothetical protein